MSKWKIKKPDHPGAPLREKDWLRLSEVLRAAKDDLAYNHNSKIPCQKIDMDIEKLDEAFIIAHSYWAGK